ncbi:MAG: uncharacterized protein PWQ31_1316 [Eubacteriales bacterium]|nr:uncharacterized protein [Eubacteriales bacterium]
MRRGIFDLPLHDGRCPVYLFQEMKELGTAIMLAIAREFGPEEILRRLADPVWFQSLGCLLGFDWHSSGLTTTVCGALKEGLRPWQKELGLFIAGGKGKVSRNTPAEIEEIGSKHALPLSVVQLQSISKLVAKVDTAALQDGFDLYHHVFIFTTQGSWAVIQQGMRPDLRYARRYHWYSGKVTNFVEEPHSGICCDYRGKVLNLTARESRECRQAIVSLLRESPALLEKGLGKTFRNNLPPATGEQLSLFADASLPAYSLPARHSIPRADYLNKILYKLYEHPPADFIDLLTTPGVGKNTVRALAMTAEVIYGAKPSFTDPVRYSFAHGGKDGHPFPVDRKTYRQTILSLHDALNAARVGDGKKIKALKKLSEFLREVEGS